MLNFKIASQNRIARNEDRTPGACLIHLGGIFIYLWPRRILKYL